VPTGREDKQIKQVKVKILIQDLKNKNIKPVPHCHGNIKLKQNLIEYK
jgi:hypothetical protein